MKKPTVTALALLLMFPLVAASQAEDAGRRQAAEELARLAYASESRGDIAGTLVDVQIERNPRFAPYRESLLTWLRSLLSWEVIGPSMIDSYESHFSEAELRDIIAFYKTPTGQKVLENMSSIYSGAASVARRLAKERQGELEKLINAEIWKEAGDALREQADGLYEEEKWAEARDAYTRYLEAHPQDADVVSDLGICYRGLGDLERALQEFDRALAIDSGHWHALFNKVLVVGLDMGRKSEARKLLAKLQSLQPDNPDVQKLTEAINEK